MLRKSKTGPSHTKLAELRRYRYAEFRSYRMPGRAHRVAGDGVKCSYVHDFGCFAFSFMRDHLPENITGHVHKPGLAHLMRAVDGVQGGLKFGGHGIGGVMVWSPAWISMVR